MSLYVQGVQASVIKTNIYVNCIIYFSSASRQKDYDVTRSSVCGGILKGWCVGSGHGGISYKDE